MSFKKIYEAQLNTALSWKCGGSTPAPQHCIRTSIVEVATVNLQRWRLPERTLSLQLLHLHHFCERWLVPGWEWEGGGPRLVDLETGIERLDGSVRGLPRL